MKIDKNKNKKERRAAIARIRNDGIVAYNRMEAAKVQPKYTSAKRGKEEKPLTVCSNCKITVMKYNFSRHKKLCQPASEESVISRPISTISISTEYNEDYVTDILGKLRDDDVRNLIRKDSTLVLIGSKLFWAVRQKKDKYIEVCRDVRGNLRNLARLYSIFVTYDITKKYDNAHDMFNRDNFDQLTKAIEAHTTNEDNKLMPGLKANLYYLIKKCAKIVENHLFDKRQDQESEEVSKFLKSFESWKVYIFGDATYQLNKNKNVNLRNPNRLPNEGDITLLKNHATNKIAELSDAYHVDDAHTYVVLRNMLCTRLTLLNGRRGGEPARMLIEDFQDAVNEKWIDQQRVSELDELEKLIVKNNKIAFMTGKGKNHLVPVVMPADCMQGLKTCKSSLKI